MPIDQEWPCYQICHSVISRKQCLISLVWWLHNQKTAGARSDVSMLIEVNSPSPSSIVNIAEIADDKSASWPLSVIVSVYRHANGPLGLGSPSFSLSCCLHRPRSPLDSSTWPQLLLSPPLPSTLSSPTDPLAESVGTICAGEVTFNLPGYYFLLNVFILNTKHRLTYTTLCLFLQCSCLDNSILSSWQHALPAGIAVRSGHKMNVLFCCFFLKMSERVDHSKLLVGCTPPSPQDNGVKAPSPATPNGISGRKWMNEWKMTSRDDFNIKNNV